jgi:hypothetical protein
VDRLAIFIDSGSAEDEQARSLGIIVVQGARWEPGGGTPGFDVALSHDGTDGATTAVKVASPAHTGRRRGPSNCTV